MGYRYRKSVKLGPFRATMSKSGVSYSAGVKGARVTKRADGKVQATLSVPKTGLSYTGTTRHPTPTSPPPSGHRPPSQRGTQGHRTPQMPPPQRPRRKRSRKARGAMVVVILIGMITSVALVENSHSRHGPPLPASLPEDLQLSGVVNGRLTTATSVQGMTSSFPGGPSGQGSGFGPTDATACVQNTGEGWELDLYGRVGAHEMSLSFDGQDLSDSNMAGNYAGTHDIDNNASFGGLVYFYWGSVNLDYPVVGSATLVVNSDGSSGTMNIQLTDNPPASGSTKLETITGSWRCA